MRETRVRFLGLEDPLEKEMTIHSSTLAWNIPWTKEPFRLQSMGSQRVEHDFIFTFIHKTKTFYFSFYFLVNTRNLKFDWYRLFDMFFLMELGPTLLFVKVNQGKEETRRFYACSACRDRKDCNFFLWEDEKVYHLFGYIYLFLTCVTFCWECMR